MIINYYTYINESSESIKVGDKVKIREDSKHYAESYRDNGNGYGVITKIYVHDEINKEVGNTYYNYVISWEISGYVDTYRLLDFDLVDNIEDEPTKIRWFKNGKLNENLLEDNHKPSKNDIGRKVKMYDGSVYRNQAYEYDGNGTGRIINYYNDQGDHVYRVKWDGGYIDAYRLKDLEWGEEENSPVKVRWYKNGKLNEHVVPQFPEDDISGSRVKVKEHSELRNVAYKHGGNGYGTIIDLHSNEHWDPKTKIQYYYYKVIWDNGYESICKNRDFEIEIEPDRIRWYKNGKLNESLYRKHKPSYEDIGKRVKISNNSAYKKQAYGKDGNGKGTILHYYTDEDGGDTDDYVYNIKWDNGVKNQYRLIDLEWDEGENLPTKIRWYKNGKLNEKILNEYFQKSSDPLNVIGKIITFDSPEEAVKIKNKLMEFGYTIFGHGSIKYDIMNKGFNSFVSKGYYSFDFELGNTDKYHGVEHHKPLLVRGGKLLKNNNIVSKEPWGDDPEPKIKWYKKGKFVDEGIKWYNKGKLISDPDYKIEVIERENDYFITDKEFKDFLIEHDCLDEYIKNCNKDFIESFDNCDRGDYIDNAFTWRNSPQSDEFWSELSNEWIDYLAYS